MGFRFRRRFRIAPGIRLNIGKSGLSTSLGGRGFTVNLGRGKTRTTVGLPGTGISYSETTMPGTGRRGSGALIWLFVIGILVVAMTLFLAGCAATYSQPTRVAPEASKHIPGSQAVLLRAAKQVLVSEGFQITNADDAAGVISTAPRDMRLTPDLADCGTTLGLDYLKDNRTSSKVAFGALASDNKVTIKATMSATYLPASVDQSIRDIRLYVPNLRHPAKRRSAKML